MEIERKFLVKMFPGDLMKWEKHEIIQAYIATDPTLRLREIDGKYWLTFKGEGKMIREEFEYELTQEQFARLWEKVETRQIEKTRYDIVINGSLTAELDIYHGNLAGLLTVEVEFSSLEEAYDFKPLDWFGEEVTEDARYSNSYLAINGKFTKK